VREVFISDDRSVSPVVATILMVAVVVVIAASIGAVAFGFTGDLGGTSIAANEGQCLQSVNFDPNDIDSFADSAAADLDCVLWFDATQESFSDGQEVDQWTDRSGNGFDATSSTEPGVSNPEYVEDLDGVSAVRFEDGGGIEGLDTDATANEIGIDGRQSFTTSVVIRPNQDSDGAILQAGTIDGTAWGYQPDLASDQWLFQISGDGEFYFISYDDADDDEDWVVVSTVYDGNSISIYKNGRSLVEADVFEGGDVDESDINVTDTPFNIGFFNWDGPDNGLDGAIAEVVVLDDTSRDIDREVLECTFDEKHGSNVNVEGC